MAQQLHVLRCYSCKMYQVQIVKKVQKWQCKICNEKQMTQVVYFQGSGAECRQYVQARNLESASDKDLAVIDGWGFDCEAEEEPEDPCDCGERKLTAEKLSSYLSDGKYESKENLGLEQNSPKRRKLNCGGKMTRSLPGKLLSRSDKRNSKLRSLAAVSEKIQLPNKYTKFLEPETILKVTEATDERNYPPEEKLPHFFDSEHKNRPNEQACASDSPPWSSSLENRCETNVNNLSEDFEPVDKKTEACEQLISSQVDESSNSSPSSFRGIVTSVFDDLDDDLDFELDF